MLAFFVFLLVCCIGLPPLVGGRAGQRKVQKSNKISKNCSKILPGRPSGGHLGSAGPPGWQSGAQKSKKTPSIHPIWEAFSDSWATCWCSFSDCFLGTLPEGIFRDLGVQRPPKRRPLGGHLEVFLGTLWKCGNRAHSNAGA